MKGLKNRNKDVFQTHPPGLASNLSVLNLFDWNFILVPQTRLYERSFTYIREKILGGCSLYNKFISKFVKKTKLPYIYSDTGNVDSIYYTRESKDDWNSESDIIGTQQLSWNEMLLFILRVRSQTQYVLLSYIL